MAQLELLSAARANNYSISLLAGPAGTLQKWAENKSSLQQTKSRNQVEDIYRDYLNSGHWFSVQYITSNHDKMVLFPIYFEPICSRPTLAMDLVERFIVSFWTAASHGT